MRSSCLASDVIRGLMRGGIASVGGAEARGIERVRRLLDADSLRSALPNHTILKISARP